MFNMFNHIVHSFSYFVHLLYCMCFFFFILGKTLSWTICALSVRIWWRTWLRRRTSYSRRNSKERAWRSATSRACRSSRCESTAYTLCFFSCDCKSTSSFFFFFFYICPWKSCICTVHQAQLQDAKRRWEELQSYLHSVNTEREKLQAAKQGRWCRAVLLCFTHIRKHIHGSYQYHSLSELQSQLLAVETEMNNKNKEIQTLHSSLTDTMVSKEQVEQKVMQLLEVSQHNLQPDNSLQAQVQVPCVLFFS